MGVLDKAFKRCKKFIELVKAKPGTCIGFSTSFPVLSNLQYAPTARNLGDGYDVRVIRAYQSALGKIGTFYGDPNLDTRLETDILLDFATELGYTGTVVKDGKVSFSQVFNLDRDLSADLETLDTLMKADFQYGLDIEHASQKAVSEVLSARYEQTKNFYIEEKGRWLDEFIPALGDELSKISFIHYLEQRIMASVFADSPICYPVKPPRQSSKWRKDREIASYNFPLLKDPSGKDLGEIYFLCTYIYEQYRVPGCVEPELGDVVIDAGAFVGDTAAWFSERVGSSGRVFSFEILPDSISCGRENMARNNIHNVEFINSALADKTADMPVAQCEGCGSTATVDFSTLALEVGDLKVTSVTLDEFRLVYGKIDFIKADIEGSKMAMLKGAQETIVQDGPKCAICLYHKKDDFWEIPDLLKSLRPDYRFWFRCESEPVLYAKIADTQLLHGV